MYLISVLEGEKKGNGGEAIFEEIIAENFPKYQATVSRNAMNPSRRNTKKKKKIPEQNTIKEPKTNRKS